MWEPNGGIKLNQRLPKTLETKSGPTNIIKAEVKKRNVLSECIIFRFAYLKHWLLSKSIVVSSDSGV